MRVKQIDKVIDLYEIFAKNRSPMTLSVIAKELAIPKSSAFNIIETLCARGYLYETRPRGGYYPTSQLADLSRSIAGEELLIQRLHAHLEALAEETGETTMLAAREHSEIVYLDVVECTSAVRYTARVGQRRLLHTTSSGKAILFSYPEDDRRIVLDGLAQTLPPPEYTELVGELTESAARGWAEDRGQTMPDVTGFGVPVITGRWRLGLAVAGPAYRVDPKRKQLVEQIISRRDRIMREIG